MVERPSQLIVVSIDGITTRLTGIGVMVNTLFRELESLTLPVGITVDAIGPFVARESDDYSREAHVAAALACHARGGRVTFYDVPDSTSLSAAWNLAQPERWHESCESAVRAIAAVDRGGDLTIVVHGIMLAPLHAFLPEALRRRARVAFVAHSLGRAGDDALSVERSKWEDSAFSTMTSRDRVAYVSEYCKELLLSRYGLRERMLIPCRNGLVARQEASEAPAVSSTTLEKYSIPLQGRTVFAWGRGVPSKGFHLIIEAWMRFVEHGENRTSSDTLVVLAPLETAPANYALRLKAAAAETPSLIPIWEFDADLPRAVLTSPNLAAVVFASEFESYMLTAAEALLHAAPTVQHVFFDLPPLHEQYEGMENVVVFQERTAQALAQALDQALADNRPTGTPRNCRSFHHEADLFLRALF